MKYQVVGQFFVDQMNDLARGISPGLLPTRYINRTFNTREEAEEFALRVFPNHQEAMTEYHEINEV